MLNNSIKILYFIIISLFLYLIFSTYFSDDNILKNRDISRKFNIILSDKSKGLKILKNDTNNVIIYNSENVTNDKIKKRKIWELLK